MAASIRGRRLKMATLLAPSSAPGVKLSSRSGESKSVMMSSTESWARIDVVVVVRELEPFADILGTGYG